MPNSNGSIDLSSLSEEERQGVEALAEAQGDEAPEAESNEGQPLPLITAFLVLVHPDGNPEVRSFEDPSLDIKFKPTADLIYGAAGTIQKDLAGAEQAEAAAHAVIGIMEARARQAMEAQQAQQIKSQLGDLKRV